MKPHQSLQAGAGGSRENQTSSDQLQSSHGRTLKLNTGMKVPLAQAGFYRTCPCLHDPTPHRYIRGHSFFSSFQGLLSSHDMPGTISGPQGTDVWLDNCGNLGGALLKFPSSSRTCCKNLPLESMRRFMPRP